MTDRPIRHSPSTGRGSPDVWGLYEPQSGSIQYVCACPATGKAALIDVVRDFDLRSARTGTASMDAVLALVAREGLEVVWVLDTHPHADHLMASALLGERTGAPTAIGEGVREVAALWTDLYNLPGAFDPTQSFTRLLAPGDRLEVGDLVLAVEHSPGHTLASVTFHAGDASFVHDTLMMPDMGSSRADFPGGSAAALWDSIRSILSRPEGTRLFVGHDYGTPEREERRWEATVGEHLARNVHVGGAADRAAFIRLREARDRTLPLPERMLAALQVNLRGGRLPEPESDGHRYLKLPLDRFDDPSA